MPEDGPRPINRFNRPGATDSTTYVRLYRHRVLGVCRNKPPTITALSELRQVFVTKHSPPIILKIRAHERFLAISASWGKQRRVTCQMVGSALVDLKALLSYWTLTSVTNEVFWVPPLSKRRNKCTENWQATALTLMDCSFHYLFHNACQAHTVAETK